MSLAALNCSGAKRNVTGFLAIFFKMRFSKAGSSSKWTSPSSNSTSVMEWVDQKSASSASDLNSGTGIFFLAIYSLSLRNQTFSLGVMFLTVMTRTLPSTTKAIVRPTY